MHFLPLNRAIAFAAVAVALGVSACAAQVSDPAEPIPTIEQRIACIELTQRGLGNDAIDASLVNIATSDSTRAGDPIKLYKVVAGPAANYYVFLGRWEHIYMVYETDASGSRFVGKYRYGSLHRPCPTSGGTPQTSP